jgi:serine protease inhibitor
VSLLFGVTRTKADAPGTLRSPHGLDSLMLGYRDRPRQWALGSMFLVTLIVAACGTGEPLGPIDELPRPLTASEVRLVESTNTFAFKIFNVLAPEHADSNLFMSPLSVSMALGMAYNGADGNTKAEMATALALDNMSVDEANRAFRSLIDLLLDLDSRVEMNLANSIWARAGVSFEQAFLDVNRQYFDARIESLDFTKSSASQTINDWVSDATHGRIASIVPNQIPADIVMYLINAIYFKGTWTARFDKGETRDRAFTLAGGSVAQVPTMAHAGAHDFGVFANNDVQVVDLPYGGGAFSMTLVVPQPGVSVDHVIGTLDDGTWRSWVDGLDEGSVIVEMPKFTIQYGASLNDALRTLGMVDAFTENADFSKMRSARDLQISSVEHKAWVNVDEDGTEAAAATSVGVGVVCACGPLVFRVDRPFFFAIRERFSGTILFMGRVVDPQQN